MNTPAIPLNEWSRVEVAQFQPPDKSYHMTVMMGDSIVDQVTNTDPREFKYVKVFTSDNYYETAKARIDNLKISTFPDGYPMYTNYTFWTFWTFLTNVETIQINSSFSCLNFFLLGTYQLVKFNTF